MRPLLQPTRPSIRPGLAHPIARELPARRLTGLRLQTDRHRHTTSRALHRPPRFVRRPTRSVFPAACAVPAMQRLKTPSSRPRPEAIIDDPSRVYPPPAPLLSHHHTPELNTWHYRWEKST